MVLVLQDRFEELEGEAGVMLPSAVRKPLEIEQGKRDARGVLDLLCDTIILVVICVFILIGFLWFGICFTGLSGSFAFPGLAAIHLSCFGCHGFGFLAPHSG